MLAARALIPLSLFGCAEGPGALPGQVPGPQTFDLEVAAVVPSEVLTLEASGVPTPGQRVNFLASTRAGAGPCAPNGSACLDIAGPPRLLGAAVAGADGVAAIDVLVPALLAEGVLAHFQAVTQDGNGVWSTSDVEERTVGDLGVCADAEEHPHDPALPVWSYHGTQDGPEEWGNLAGYAACGAGQAQTPIALETAASTGTAEVLTFHDYAIDVPLDLVNNGHTLQVNYHGQRGPGDPRIEHGGRTWYLDQLHVHSPSEHTVDGVSFPFEIHFVHQAADGSKAVVGVLAAPGGAHEIIGMLLENDPGHHMSTTCTDVVPLDALLPAGDGFFHYAGSLTTPPCTEGLSWFVMTGTVEASDAQAVEWQAEFGGPTNRPVQDLHGRAVVLNGP